ncbi:FCD domain-containing protein [Streptomyces sp. NPDC055006]
MHRTDVDLAALDAALSAIAAAEQTPVMTDAAMTDGDPVLAVRADASFHTALLTASGNPLFAQMRRVIIPALAVRDRLVHAGRHEHPLPAHARVAELVRPGPGRRFRRDARRDRTVPARTSLTTAPPHPRDTPRGTRT